MSFALSRGALRALGSAAIAWAVVFGLVHLYWAVGGDAGLDEKPESFAASLYVAAVAGIGFFAAVVARGLTDGQGPHRFRLLARLGGGALILGVAFGTGRCLAGTDTADANWIVLTAYFLLGGVLFSALGWGRAKHSRPPAEVSPRQRNRLAAVGSDGHGLSQGPYLGSLIAEDLAARRR